MKILVLLFLFIAPTTNQSLSEVRTMFLSASDSKEKAQDFFNYINQSKSNLAVIDVYKGAALTLKSKFAKTIKDKKLFFKEGALLIDATIAANPQNAEMRVIRLSIQENVPKFLGYSNSITNDHTFLIENYSKQPKDLQQFISGYVQQSKGFSVDEKMIFN